MNKLDELQFPLSRNISVKVQFFGRDFAAQLTQKDMRKFIEIIEEQLPCYPRFTEDKKVTHADLSAQGEER